MAVGLEDCWLERQQVLLNVAGGGKLERTGGTGGLMEVPVPRLGEGKGGAGQSGIQHQVVRQFHGLAHNQMVAKRSRADELGETDVRLTLGRSAFSRRGREPC